MWKWFSIFSLVFSMILSAEVKVLAIAGSSREGSVNKKLIHEASKWLSKNGAAVTTIDLLNYPIPFYNEDLEFKEGMPEKAKELRKLMIESQLILIASPEYNGSLSSLLKNVIDWASRSEQGKPSRDAFKGKNFAIMSAAPGQLGGSRGLAHLRSILEAIGGTVLPEQFVLPSAYDAFDSAGHLKSEAKREELQKFLKNALGTSR